MLMRRCAGDVLIIIIKKNKKKQYKHCKQGCPEGGRVEERLCAGKLLWSDQKTSLFGVEVWLVSVLTAGLKRREQTAQQE